MLITRAAARRPDAAIRALFAAGEQGAWYDPADWSTLYQDGAGTQPVTAVGQPVGKMLDKSGRGNHATQSTQVNRPTLQQDAGGRYYLSFDGVNGCLQTASIDFSGTDKATIFAGLRKLSDAAIGMVCELTADATTGNGFYMAAPGSGATYRLACGSPSSQVLSTAAFVAPITNVLTATYDKAQASAVAAMSLRVNGAQNAVSESVAGDPAGNFANGVLYIGRRAGSSLPFSGNLYGLIIRGALPNASQIAQAEAFINQRTGAY
jgi:hypothetical protein